MRRAARAAWACVGLAACGPSLGSAPAEPDLTAACVIATACSVLEPDVSLCLNLLFGVNQNERAIQARVTPAEVSCLAHAADCTAAAACLPGIEPLGACGGSGCTGTVSHVCFNGDQPGGSTADFDCAQVGLDCISTASICGSGVCTGAGNTCSGSRVFTCDVGAGREIDCGRFDAACGSLPDGSFDCIGSGAHCSPTEPASCDGDTVVSCLNGGEARTDCTSLGAHCVSDGFQAVCGFGSECSAAFQNACAGRFLILCNHGKIDTVDCVALGFRGCDPSFGTCSP